MSLLNNKKRKKKETIVIIVTKTTREKEKKERISNCPVNVLAELQENKKERERDDSYNCN
jgi:hypothetical protein